jgi:hypothetical protein
MRSTSLPLPTPQTPISSPTTLEAAKAQAPRLAALAGRTAVRSASGRLVLLPAVPLRTA